MLGLISIIVLALLAATEAAAAGPDLMAGCSGAAVNQIRCYGASQFYICPGDNSAVVPILQSVAAGTECVNGKIDAASIKKPDSPPPAPPTPTPKPSTPPLRSPNSEQQKVEAEKKQLADLKSRLREVRLCKTNQYYAMKLECECIDRAGLELLANEKMCNNAGVPTSIVSAPGSAPPRPSKTDTAAMVNPKLTEQDTLAKVKEAMRKQRICNSCGKGSQCEADCDCIAKAGVELLKNQKMCNYVSRPSNPKPASSPAAPATPEPPKSPDDILRDVKKRLSDQAFCTHCASRECHARCDCIATAGIGLIKDEKMCDKAGL